MTTVTDFMSKTKGLTRNPLGIIALFVSLIYGFACLVLSTSLNNIKGQEERLPLIWFIIIFPILILSVFTYLVVKHHRKLYAPSDYKDEKNFVNAFMGNKDVSSDLDKVSVDLKSLSQEKDSKHLIATINKISNEIEKIKDKSEQIPINNLWKLNHWRGDCAKVVGDKMIFEGLSAPKGEDGSHININDFLEIGSSYEISCLAKSTNGTTGMFRLWCHDKTSNEEPHGVNVTTPLKTPSTEGEIFKLTFIASYNKNVRIHLQYKIGQGRIEVSDVKISKLKK